MPVLRRYFLLTTVLLGGLLGGTQTGLSLARADAGHGIGILPPADPRADCGGWGLAGIDACRATEGLGKLILPSNSDDAEPADKLLVLVDLEWVNRGRAPVSGLLTPLNALARQGAALLRAPAGPRAAWLISAH